MQKKGTLFGVVDSKGTENTKKGEKQQEKNTEARKHTAKTGHRWVSGVSSLLPVPSKQLPCAPTRPCPARVSDLVCADPLSDIPRELTRVAGNCALSIL